LKFVDLGIDLLGKTVRRDDKQISLMVKEYYLLECLLKNSSRLVSKLPVFSEVWDINADVDSSKMEVYSTGSETM
jgi:DNA-binding response OmpR family regulator